MSDVKRSLLRVCAWNRKQCRYVNAKLVHQLQLILKEIRCLIQLRMLTLAAHHKKLRALPPPERMRRDRDGYLDQDIRHGEPYMGEAGLQGDALSVYLGLKNGQLPTVAIHLYGGE